MAIPAPSTTPRPQGIKVICACTIHCPIERLYAFWRQMENLPLIMERVGAVTTVSATESHWVAKREGRKVLEWDAEITADSPNRLIEWRTKGGMVPAYSGAVRFEPAIADRGTEITVSLELEPPANMDDGLLDELFGEEPGAQLADDLRRFKVMMEAGGPVGMPQRHPPFHHADRKGGSRATADSARLVTR